jgi:hypothetical protein
MNIDRTPAVSAMNRVLPNQATKSVLLNSLLKFSKLAPVGMSCEELRVPIGLSAADTTNTMGNSAKNRAITPIRWRQPTCRHHPPLALPSRTTASF